MRVALDLLGGGLSLEAGLQGAGAALAERGDLQLLLIGPKSTASARAASVGLDPSRLAYADSETCVDDLADPVGAVRASRIATIRLAHRSVRDAEVDACVTASAPPVAVAAASFALSSLPGVTQPSFATLVGPADHPVVLLDAGASTPRSVDAFVQLAVCGVVLARAALGITAPRVGFLDGASSQRTGDAATAFDDAVGAILARVVGVALGSPEVATWVGSTGAEAVALGSSIGGCDILVTDAASARLVLGAARGGALAARSAIMSATSPVRGADDGDEGQLQALFGRGGFVLGVGGISVVAAGSSADSIRGAILLAARAADGHLVANLSATMAGLVADRRAAAGFGSGG